MLTVDNVGALTEASCLRQVNLFYDVVPLSENIQETGLFQENLFIICLINSIVVIFLEHQRSTNANFIMAKDIYRVICNHAQKSQGVIP